MRVVLISTYELGRQPFGLASPAAWLREAGIDVRCLDLSREKFSADVVDADFVAFYLPMHTATRLAIPLIQRVRASAPRIRICCYGLYAPPNEALLRSLGVDYVLGGEFEEALLRIVTSGEKSADHPVPLTLTSVTARGAPGLRSLGDPASYGEARRSTEGAKAAPPLALLLETSLGSSGAPPPLGPQALTRSSHPSAAAALGAPAPTPVRLPHWGPRAQPPQARSSLQGERGRMALPRLRFRVPDRRDLPPLARYATLQFGGTRRTCGYTEASRGCKHFCRHCPVVPVYEGRFRVVPVDVVEADIRGQVEAGAEHMTFGDPDFFNGIRHALAVVDMVGREFPGLTYDVTIKIEHLLQHHGAVSRLQETGCLFVTSAVESVDDGVLSKLRKGHSRADFERALGRCRDAGVTLVPTFVPFTPWISLAGYGALLSAIDELDLIDAVAPIQLAIRLLVPAGSHLLELADLRSVLEPFDPARLCYPWRHPDARVDALYEEVSERVARSVDRPRREAFASLVEAAVEHGALEAPIGSAVRLPDRATVPYLNEPWYC